MEGALPNHGKAVQRCESQPELRGHVVGTEHQYLAGCEYLPRDDDSVEANAPARGDWRASMPRLQKTEPAYHYQCRRFQSPADGILCRPPNQSSRRNP